jgi:hypothetical protein
MVVMILKEDKKMYYIVCDNITYQVRKKIKTTE